MVKGISRQVIVVDSPDKKLFDQAIFILKDGQLEVTDQALLKEAGRLIGTPRRKNIRSVLYGSAWACGGAVLTGIIWLLSTVL